MSALAGTSEIGRSILVPPGVPPERLAALRAAFQAMMKDPQFIASTEKRKLMIDGATGEQMDAVTRDTMKLPKETIDALRRVMQN
jgi:tripartite-type tricarboxylate transporter receptor subunit TctC